MPATTHTVIHLPGPAWAVIETDSAVDTAAGFYRTVAVCDREADAQRVAYCLHVVGESEVTAKRDEAAA